MSLLSKKMESTKMESKPAFLKSAFQKNGKQQDGKQTRIEYVISDWKRKRQYVRIRFFSPNFYICKR